MPSTINEDIAGRLDEVARILAEQGANHFRVQAYHQAAAVLRGLARPVSEIFPEEGLAGLEKLPGVGESIGRAIRDILRQGRLAETACEATSSRMSMKSFTTFLLVLAGTLGASSSRLGGNWSMAAEPGAPPERVGVYDSRAIAYAHFWSDARQRELNELTKAARAAKASGQTERFHELEAAIKKQQETNHLQVFSTAPVDEALVALKDRLPAIQKEAGVATLVSKWDEVTLNAHKRAKQVDVTELLVREFKLDEKKMNVARAITKQKPLPLGKAQKLMRRGKL